VIAYYPYPVGLILEQLMHSNGTRLHRFLQEMNREALDGYDCMTTGWVARLVARETTIRQGL